MFASAARLASRRSVAGLSRGGFVRSAQRTRTNPLSVINQARCITFKAPTRDISFCFNEVLDAEKIYKAAGHEEVDRDFIDSVVGEAGKFCENVLAPLNALGDQQGCVRSDDGHIKTPDGFKEAYKQYCEAGWQSLAVPEAYGGQGLPASLGVLKTELVGTSNWSWGMYPGLSIGAMNTLLLHGSEEQKQVYVSKLASGEWTGTMCLTEPQCGTDLGQVKTKAEPTSDGKAYKITGTKIFISCGEHDMADNILHIVLARLPGAPAGTKGISLFLVPKHVITEDGSLSKERNLTCGGIEQKMGIKASATCVMNFDESEGYLIGAPNTGLRQMFTFMNAARLGTAVQGIGTAELAYQNSLPYALERMSMRSLQGAAEPDKPADRIIVHPDVRRMLLTQKAFAEGGRMMTYHAALLADGTLVDDPEKRKAADNYLGLFTPICKGFLTEVGQESASHAVQVWGGHGYIKENGVEQIYRDNRISTLYEGTTGVQALDLLGRKVLLNKGKLLYRFCGEVLSDVKRTVRVPELRVKSAKIGALALQWQYLSAKMAAKSVFNKDTAGAAATDFLMYSGYVSMGYWWLRMAEVANKELKANPDGPDAGFYRTKLKTCDFYFDTLLPRAQLHASTMGSVKSTMAVTEEEFKSGLGL